MVRRGKEGVYVHASPATENKTKAMYPLTVLLAPSVAALPVAELSINELNTAVRIQGSLRREWR